MPMLNNDKEPIPTKSVKPVDLVKGQEASPCNKEAIVVENGQANETLPASLFYHESKYPGDLVDDSPPLKDDKYQTLEFPSPALFLSFYVKYISDGNVTLHPWQVKFHEDAAAAKPTAQHPYKHALLTCNGSGKDAFIIAGWAAWFAVSKIRSRCIITSASGVQLTGQTENYIRTICQAVNDFHGAEIFRIRQRFIRCLLSGSEIRMFATDEAGKAEGYHPLEPNSEMTIIVNEAKTVAEEIFGALRRCTGYNYWFNISSAGEPSGSFYKAYINWPHKTRVTAYDCPHISREEIEDARVTLGEHSALFRSIYLALFTSLGGELIIPKELIDKLLDYLKDSKHLYTSLGIRIGIDLAAGAAENSICFALGNKCIKEVAFVEQDTEITADRIDLELTMAKIPKNHPHIYADDGGVGRSIIDKLIRKGWKINRVLNQTQAAYKREFGNKGAENWFRVSRILEERFFDVNTLTDRTREQLYTRHYKKTAQGGKIFLESKKEAIAEGRPSPDRADAFILSQSGLTVDDYIKYRDEHQLPIDKRPKDKFTSMDDVYEHYESKVTFVNYEKKVVIGKRTFGSLSAALSRN
jgi:phage terminase large subunit